MTRLSQLFSDLTRGFDSRCLDQNLRIYMNRFVADEGLIGNQHPVEAIA